MAPADGPQITVDEAVFNAARITKLYGTMACKGGQTSDRPHRKSRIISAPENIEAVSVHKLQAVAGLASAANTAQPTNGKSAPHAFSALLHPFIAQPCLYV